MIDVVAPKVATSVVFPSEVETEVEDEDLVPDEKVVADDVIVVSVEFANVSSTILTKFLVRFPAGFEISR